ncbi:hypothetical protein [Pseudovibrio sp. Tun.PSC04-5.I4]|nr:hypothetical protein [Pseudovibrio sp. Tun.PSC04-5.I4]
MIVLVGWAPFLEVTVQMAEVTGAVAQFEISLQLAQSHASGHA